MGFSELTNIIIIGNTIGRICSNLERIIKIQGFEL